MRQRERWLLIAMGALLGAVGVVSFTRAARLRYDFHHFYRDAAYVWQHGRLNPDFDDPDRTRRRQLPFYLPVVALMLAPLTAGGVTPAALAWTLGHLICLAYILMVLADWSAARGSRAPPRAALVLAVLVALPVIYEAARFNQVSFFTLALVLGGVTALERGRPVAGGLWLGLAVVLKLLPAIFAIWLALKRQWTALGTLLVTALVAAVLPCLVVFGPHETAQYHRQWWDYNVQATAARATADSRLRSHFIDHRNQSIAAVVGRLCWSEHPQAVSFQPLKLDERSCRPVAQMVMLALVLALIGLTWRPIPGWRSPQTGDPRRQRFRIEAATYLLAMLVLSPLLRTYYLVWALPALVLLTRFALDERVRAAQRLGQIGLAIWLAGMLAWMSAAARSCGVHLIMSVALGAILLWLARCSSERPATRLGRIP